MTSSNGFHASKTERFCQGSIKSHQKNGNYTFVFVLLALVLVATPVLSHSCKEMFVEFLVVTLTRGSFGSTEQMALLLPKVIFGSAYLMKG